MLTCFRELSQAKDTYDAACQALDLANTAEVQAKGALRDAQQQEQQERDQLLEAFSRRQESNQELRLSPGRHDALKKDACAVPLPRGLDRRSTTRSTPVIWTGLARFRMKKTGETWN